MTFKKTSLPLPDSCNKLSLTLHVIHFLNELISLINFSIINEAVKGKDIVYYAKLKETSNVFVFLLFHLSDFMPLSSFVFRFFVFNHYWFEEALRIINKANVKLAAVYITT